MDIYSLRSKLLKALAHPQRLQIIDFLTKEGEQCVCHMADLLGIPQPTISKHLAQLKEAGILESRKKGLMIIYKVRTPCVNGFFQCLDGILQEDLMAKQKAYNAKD